MHTPPGTDTHAPCRLCQARTALPLLPLEGEQDGAQHSTCREGQRALPWLQKSHAAGNFSTQAKITSRWALLNLLCRGGRGGAEQMIQTSTKRFGNSRSQCPVALARRERASFEHSAPPSQGEQQTGGTARSLHSGAHPLCQDAAHR